MSMLHRTMRRIEEMKELDGFARPLSSAGQKAVRPRLIRNLLSGTYLGHPAHPPLTDVPIGAW
ncbi:MAG: (2Fe-2S)-binding protein, partial [Actinomadura sp.]